jgi:hypothetical protein
MKTYFIDEEGQIFNNAADEYNRTEIRTDL